MHEYTWTSGKLRLSVDVAEPQIFEVLVNTGCAGDTLLYVH